LSTGKRGERASNRRGGTSEASSFPKMIFERGDRAREKRCAKGGYTKIDLIDDQQKNKCAFTEWSGTPTDYREGAKNRGEEEIKATRQHVVKARAPTSQYAFPGGYYLISRIQRRENPGGGGEVVDLHAERRF